MRDIRFEALEAFYKENNIIVEDIHDYNILSDAESNAETKEYVLKHAWNFNPSFFAGHMSENKFSSVYPFKEENNDLILKAIKSKNRFVECAIKSCGRGWFLSGYDGLEHEFEYQGKIWYIYRNN